MELASGSRTAVWTFSVKGGVGKTTWARGLRALARAAGQPIAAYDGDGMRGGLTRYEALRTVEGELLDPSGRHFLMLQDALEGVVPFYMRDPAQRDMLLNVIDTSFQTFLIDFPGDIEREIEEIVGATREVIRVYRESGVDVVVVIPITTEPTSINSIEVAFDAFEDMVRYIAAKNAVSGPPGRLQPATGFAVAVFAGLVRALRPGILDRLRLDVAAQCKRSMGSARSRLRRCRRGASG